MVSCGTSKGSGKIPQINFQRIAVKEQEITCFETKNSSFTKLFLENEQMATTSTRPYCFLPLSA
jgi:Holliday junction resolvase